MAGEVSSFRGEAQMHCKQKRRIRINGLGGLILNQAEAIHLKRGHMVANSAAEAATSTPSTTQMTTSIRRLRASNQAFRLLTRWMSLAQTLADLDGSNLKSAPPLAPTNTKAAS